MKISSGTRVLVLGGASAIAQEFCRVLAPRGAKFFLAGRNCAHLEAVAADLKVRGSGAVFSKAVDLSRVETHEQLLDRAWAGLGGVDLCLLAYGVLGDQEQAEKSFEEAHRILQTNFTSAASLILRIASRFEAQSSGALAVIGSVAGDRGRKSNFVYGTSKSALATLMQGLRHRYHGSGLCFLTVKAGMVETPMTAHLAKSPLFASARKVAEAIVKAIEKEKRAIYAPGYWRGIMFAIRNVPEAIFHKTNF
jgi:short-subunit dehydrogenase